MTDPSANLTQRLRMMSADEKVRLSHALWVEAWNVASRGSEGAIPIGPRSG